MQPIHPLLALDAGPVGCSLLEVTLARVDIQAASSVVRVAADHRPHLLPRHRVLEVHELIVAQDVPRACFVEALACAEQISERRHRARLVDAVPRKVREP
eukprot:6294433-Prymnesium_polylepis.2